MSGRDGLRPSGLGGPAGVSRNERGAADQPEPTDARDSPELRAAEQNARRALGLGPGGFAAGRPRRRFVRDGEVAVVVLPRADTAADAPAGATPTRNRLAAAETARDAERSARLRAERMLAEVQAAFRQLQTQLGHAAMTQEEARQASERALAERQALEQALADEREARAKAEDALEQLLNPRKPRAVRGPRADEAASRSAGRPRRAAEPKPVKWWVKASG